jgi:transposase
MRMISLEAPHMEKGERHRNYDPEFKQEVLRLVAEGKPAFKVAEDLGIRADLIYAWRKREKRGVGAVAFAQAGGKVLTPEEELKALREELAVTRRERDILKKALAIFSKEPQNR